MQQFQEIKSQAGEHIATVIQMMIDGVAFPSYEKDGRVLVYKVFSHEGDELGAISTSDVGYVIKYMKTKWAIRVGKLPHGDYGVHKKSMPAFTFAWSGWYVFKG